MKWYNEKAIYIGTADTCYPNFVLSTMDEFEQHLYLYYFNGLNPSPRIHMKLKYSSADPVKVKYFLNKTFARNAVRQ